MGKKKSVGPSPVLALGAILLTGGCVTAIDNDSVKLFSSAVEVATEPLQKDLAKAVQQEEKDHLAKRVQDGLPAYFAPDGCLDLATDRTEASLRDCRLEIAEPAPADAGTAKMSLIYLNTLLTYARTLASLATSEAPGNLAADYAEFAGAAKTLAAEIPDMNADAKALNEAVAPVGGLISNLTEVARARAVKKIVARADAPLENILRALIAERAKTDGLKSGQKKLEAKYDSMVAAQGQPGYAAAVRAYEAELKSFQKKAAKAHSPRLLDILKAHRALHNSLQEGGSPEATLDFLESIKAVADLI